MRELHIFELQALQQPGIAYRYQGVLPQPEPEIQPEGAQCGGHAGQVEPVERETRARKLGITMK